MNIIFCEIIVFVMVFLIILLRKRNVMKAVVLVFLTLIMVGFVYFYNFFNNNYSKTIYIDREVIDTKINDNSNMNIDSSKLERIDNLYYKFNGYGIDEINFSSLKDINSDVVSWIAVDGTNINYPVVQSEDNEYYLEHDLLKRKSYRGWIFLDYRNDYKMHDMNTIFYGHNLRNGDAFSSLENIFTDKWFNNSSHYIIVLIGKKKYVYEIFSCYYSDANTYYLQNNFISSDDYYEFLNNIKDKSKYNFSVSLNRNDQIITLSTCNDSNTGRKVVHAKLISNK